jgi:hypothetical protein
MRRTGHIARMGENGANTVFVGEPEKKTPLGRPTTRWQAAGYELDLRGSERRPVLDSCEHGSKLWCSLKFREIS